MEESKKLIWAYYSKVRQNLDNDYYFYEDGSILHHYDRTMTKWDIEEFVLPSNISYYDKQMIVNKCKLECSEDVVEKIKRILEYK